MAVDFDVHRRTTDGVAHIVAGLIEMNQLDGCFGSIVELHGFGLPEIQIDSTHQRDQLGLRGLGEQGLRGQNAQQKQDSQ